MSSESSAPFPKAVFQKREDTSFYQRWKVRAAAISHPDYIFLSPGFSPDSCVPCRGLTEWIAEAWRSGDLKSIARLIRRIIVASKLPKNARDRLVLLPYDMAGIDTRATMEGLNGRQSSFLVAAYILQEVVSGREENSTVSPAGCELLAASVMPLRLAVIDLDEQIQRANQVLEDLRSNGTVRGVPADFEQDEFALDIADMRAGLVPILKRLGFLTTSARMHLLDALRVLKKGYSKKSLEDCASHKTREFGCQIDKTSRELFEGGYFTKTPCDKYMEGLLKKRDLQALLTNAGVTFKKSARKAELWALALEQAQPQLQARAESMGVLSLAEDIYEKRDVLIEYSRYLNRLLAVWAIGGVLPQLKALQKTVESASPSLAKA